jgi:single-strand DNA-binding protein
MSGTMATITIIGRLTRDAELKYTSTGQPVASFSVATNKKQGDQDSASFWECSLWGKLAEKISQYLHKGKLVSLSGEAWTDRWESEGQRREKTKITVDRVQMISTGEPDWTPTKSVRGEGKPPSPADLDRLFSDNVPF